MRNIFICLLESFVGMEANKPLCVNENQNRSEHLHYYNSGHNNPSFERVWGGGTERVNGRMRGGERGKGGGEVH